MEKISGLTQLCCPLITFLNCKPESTQDVTELEIGCAGHKLLTDLGRVTRLCPKLFKLTLCAVGAATWSWTSKASHVTQLVFSMTSFDTLDVRIPSQQLLACFPDLATVRLLQIKRLPRLIYQITPWNEEHLQRLETLFPNVQFEKTRESDLKTSETHPVIW
jgi:hypothetical protein